MKNLFLALCLVASAVAAKAQQTITGENISDFRNISLVGHMNVELVQSDKLGILIELNGVTEDKVSWGVSNNTLTVKARARQTEGTLVVKISYKALENVVTNGADVIFKGGIKADMLTVDASTGAKVTGKAECRDLEVKLTGNAAAQVEGTAKYLIVSAGQGSKADVRNLEAQSVQAHATMTSEIYLCALERLVADAGTGASIFFRGQPDLLRTATKMGGNINNIGK